MIPLADPVLVAWAACASLTNTLILSWVWQLCQGVARIQYLLNSPV